MLHYCVICGVLIRKTSVDPGALPTSKLAWYRNLRTVQSCDDLKYATVSGVGFINSLDRLIAPRDYQSDYKVSDATLVSYIPLYDQEHHTWCFSFHALCWDILLQRIPEGLIDITRFSSLFFQSLFCTTFDARHRYLRPGHDYGGATQFQKPVGNPIRDMIDRGREFFVACPSRAHDFPKLLSSLSENAPSFPQRPSASLTIKRQRPLAGNEIFSSLPDEVLFMIISLLPSRDVGTLRLSSRHVASVTTNTSYPQSFWRSRFSADREMGFALPSHTVGQQNWRNAYFALRYGMHDSSSSARLKNRRRIWNIAGINAALLAQHMAESTFLHGSPTEAISYDRSTGAVINAQLFNDNHDYLRSGSRILHNRGISLPLNASEVVKIRISTISFNKQKFISGLHFKLVNRHDRRTFTECCLGYLPPDTAHSIDVVPPARVTGLELAVRLHGITGIRVIFDTTSTYSNPKPQWVGDKGSGEADIAFGILNLEQSSDQIRLVASFDAFKMISLGVAETADSVPGATSQLTVKPIWTPAPPRVAVSCHPQPQALRPGVFNPILNLDFGGTNGERLPKLTRIVAHIQNHLAPFVGLTFHYNDRSCRHFGRQGSMEITSLIDGPGGELISSVTIEKSAETGRILSCQIRTNQGNEHSFTRSELGFFQVAEHVPHAGSDSSAPNPFIIAENLIVDTLEAPSGQSITGFTASLETDSGAFLSFALQCENRETHSHVTVKNGLLKNSALCAARLASPLGSYFIGERSTRAFTAASLRLIKRIRFSTGNAGRPRTTDEVSGLWFDYHQRDALVIGQWISEGASVEFDGEESINKITIWVSKGRLSFWWKHYLGRVVRVSITTSLRTVSYPDVTPLLPENCTVLRFQENYLEELSSLVWVFNSHWDFPRAVATSRSPSHKLQFWDPSELFAKHAWVAPQRALWKGSNSADSLASIFGYHGHTNKYLITGLKFTYLSGAYMDIGDLSGRGYPKAFSNDQETKRFKYNVNLAARALREIYLLPFQMVVRDADPWCMMSAYNKINGHYCDASKEILTDIARNEWHWNGVFMSDWGGTTSTIESINNGLDLEMPGPPSKRSRQALDQPVRDGVIDIDRVTDSAGRIIRLVRKAGLFADPQDRPEVCDDTPEKRNLLRRAAAGGIVMLKNEGGALPLSPATREIRKLGIFGPNSARVVAGGGGSSYIKAPYWTSVYDSVASEFKDTQTEIVFAEGARVNRYLSVCQVTVNPDTGKRGAAVDWFNNHELTGDPVVTTHSDDLYFMSFGTVPPEVHESFSFRIRATMTPLTTGRHSMSLASIGPSKLYLDNLPLLEQSGAFNEKGSLFFTYGSEEKRISTDFVAEQNYDIRIEYQSHDRQSNPELQPLLDPMEDQFNGIRLGFEEANRSDLPAEAATLGADCDASIIVVGRDKEWETEGQDILSFDLPGEQVRLIQSLAAVCPRTIVIVQAGTPVNMEPWIHQVSAVLYTWYQGQELGPAAADVLCGRVDPSGRLPVTFPRRLEDCPAFSSFPGEENEIYYTEGLFTGYRWWDLLSIEPLFPLGFGLSYSSFQVTPSSISSHTLTEAGLNITVLVTNASGSEVDVPGRETVIAWLSPCGPTRLKRPKKQIGGFAKSQPLVFGESDQVQIRLDFQAFGVFETKRNLWVIDANAEFEILVGTNAANVVPVWRVTAAMEMTWIQ